MEVDMESGRGRALALAARRAHCAFTSTVVTAPGPLLPGDIKPRRLASGRPARRPAAIAAPLADTFSFTRQRAATMRWPSGAAAPQRAKTFSSPDLDSGGPAGGPFGGAADVHHGAADCGFTVRAGRKGVSTERCDRSAAATESEVGGDKTAAYWVGQEINAHRPATGGARSR